MAVTRAPNAAKTSSTCPSRSGRRFGWSIEALFVDLEDLDTRDAGVDRREGHVRGSTRPARDPSLARRRGGSSRADFSWAAVAGPFDGGAALFHPAARPG
jgi:hypothetical protein